MGLTSKTSYKVREANRIKNRAISTKELSPKAVLIFNMWSSANIFLIWGAFYFWGIVLIKNTFGRNVVLFKPTPRI